MYIKKGWIYILTACFILLLTCFFSWSIYISSKKPITVSLKSLNPLLKNVELDEGVIIKTLQEYRYISTKKGLFLNQTISSGYKKINIILVSTERPRFPYKLKDKIYTGSETVVTPSELTINIYLSAEFINKWRTRKDLSFIQRQINRHITLELYSNSVYYKQLITRESGISFLINEGLKSKNFVIIK